MKSTAEMTAVFFLHRIENRLFSPLEIIKPKEQMLFRFYWSECRDSNSRPLEPHLHGRNGIPQHLTANSGISCPEVGKYATFIGYVKHPKHTINLKTGRQVVDDGRYSEQLQRYRVPPAAMLDTHPGALYAQPQKTNKHNLSIKTEAHKPNDYRPPRANTHHAAVGLLHRLFNAP